MTKQLISRALAVSLALSTLAGCGQSALLSAAATGTTADQASLQAKGRGERGPGQGGPMALFAQLDLSADQQTQLQAIADQYKPAAPSAQPENQLATLLTAATLDVDAVKAAFAAQPQPPQDDHRVAQLVEVRAVLTDAQRAKLVALLKAQPTPAVPSDRPSPDAARPQGDDPLVAKLSLTTEQKAAYDAFKAALDANRPAAPTARPDFAARQAAEISFWETGDTAGLTADKPAVERPAFPVDAFVAFVETLTVDQRQQAFAQGGFGFGMGPGGKGGHEGPGGREGHGGPGGFGGQQPPAQS